MGIAERVLGQRRVMEFGLGDLGHGLRVRSSSPCEQGGDRMCGAAAGHDTTLRRGVTLSASRWSPIARAMKLAVIGVPAEGRIGSSRKGLMPHSLAMSERSWASRFCSTTNTKSWSATKLVTLEWNGKARTRSRLSD